MSRKKINLHTIKMFLHFIKLLSKPFYTSISFSGGSAWAWRQGGCFFISLFNLSAWEVFCSEKDVRNINDWQQWFPCRLWSHLLLITKNRNQISPKRWLRMPFEALQASSSSWDLSAISLTPRLLFSPFTCVIPTSWLLSGGGCLYWFLGVLLALLWFWCIFSPCLFMKACVKLTQMQLMG